MKKTNTADIGFEDKFGIKYRRLVDESKSFEEDKDEYAAENIFYVPAEAEGELAGEFYTPARSENNKTTHA